MPTMAFIGDVMLGRGVNRELARRSPEWFWGTVLPTLRAADAVFANLECAVTEHRQEWRPPKVFHFRADPRAVQVLHAGNVRYVSLANNHVLDFGYQGLFDTLRHLDAAGIAHGGAGRNLDEARAPAMLDVGGLRVAVVSATDNEPAFAAADDRPGTHYLEIGADVTTRGYVQHTVERLSQAGAAPIVWSLHWGPNMTVAPSRGYQQFARAAVGDGVHILHGHSAHVVQGVQCHRNGVVLYDTGDFLDDYAVDPRLRNDWSFVFLIDLGETGTISSVRLIPVRLSYARVDLATGEEFRAICQRMQSHSIPFGTFFRETAGGLEILF